MRAVKQGFKCMTKNFLIKHIKDEGMFPNCGVAYSIYIPFYKNPIARIEVTAYMDYHSCEIAYFYVYKVISRMGVGRYLFEKAERQLKENGIHMITVVPISIMDKHLPKITDAERIEVYRHLGFKENLNEKKLIKKYRD